MASCQDQPEGDSGLDPAASDGVSPPQIIETPPLDETLTAHFKLIENKRTGPARVRLRQWLNEHPDDSRGEFLMGLSHHRDRRYARALSWLQEATRHQPIYPPAWHFLGWTHYYLGNHEPARQAFQTHLEMNPDEGDSHFGLGLLAMEAWQLDAAEDHFRQAIDLQISLPNRIKGVSKAKARLSEVLQLRDQNNAEAIRLLRESVELYPDHYEAWYRLSQLLEKQGMEDDASKALKSFEEARQRVRPQGPGSQ
ncbi:MAG: hypothetical protein CMJ29_02700 [Phycisphaerae bacterium]|nr:hypothetical protein [Phycisphaerae bacterium]